jgi:hypothetical protein
MTVHAVEIFGALENIVHYSHFECDYDLQLYAEYGSNDRVKTEPNNIVP